MSNMNDDYIVLRLAEWHVVEMSSYFKLTPLKVISILSVIITLFSVISKDYA